MEFNRPRNGEKHSHYLMGSSAVGKTTLLNEIRTEKPGFIVQPMSARTARAKLGNPEWQDLIDNKDLAMKHQDVVMSTFQDIIQEAQTSASHWLESNRKHYNGPSCNVVFERSLFDVVGYTYAFQTGYNQLAEQYKAALEHMRFRYTSIYYLTVNPDIPYAIEPGRPPENIRDAQEAFMQTLFDLLPKQTTVAYYKVDYQDREDLINHFKTIAEDN